MTQDLVTLVKFLVDKNYLYSDILEMSAEDNEDYDSLEEKLRETFVVDIQDSWAELKQGNKVITVMDKDGGIESLVRESLGDMEEEDIINLLGRVSDNFDGVMQDWNWKLDEVDDYYINDIKQLYSSRENIRASVKKTAGGNWKEELADLWASGENPDGNKIWDTLTPEQQQEYYDYAYELDTDFSNWGNYEDGVAPTPEESQANVDYIIGLESSASKKTAGGKGIGDYRRGDVLTTVNSVQPGQLLVLDSITYKATNLIKVTQTFDDKFYAIFVSPVNPAEKRQTSDEEFVVYVKDLERGEYYIALEPSPKSVSEEVGEEVVDEAPVEDAPVPAPSPDADAPIEDKAPIEASIKTAEKKYKLRHKESGEEVTWTVSQILEEINRDHSDEWQAYDESDWRAGFDEWVSHEMEILEEVTAGKKTAIQSPVREHEDYGDMPDSAQERIDQINEKKSTLEKEAMGEEPASAYDTPANNPITVDDTGDHTMKDIKISASDEDEEITTFARFQDPTTASEFEDEDGPEVAMADEGETESQWTLEYIPNFEEAVFEDQDTADSITIIYEGALGSAPVVAYYEGNEVARGDELDDLADDIKEYMDRMDYMPGILLEEERGEVKPLMIQKRGALDNFEVESDVNTAGDYAGITGSQSFAGALLAELETSANGGLGDDGSAYSLLDEGRNFTGVNEEDVEVVASQYIEGKAVSFATLADFMGFIDDAYGVTQASAEFRDAWHADDIKALSGLIAKHATKNDLQ